MLYFGKQYSGNSLQTQIFFQTNLDLEIETFENHIAYFSTLSKNPGGGYKGRCVYRLDCF